MRLIKRLFSQLHRYVLWAMVSVLFWAWIYTFLTDAPAGKKLVLYTNTTDVADRALAAALQEGLDGIDLVQVHPFSYAVFDPSAPDAADFYILSESDAIARVELLCPIPQRDRSDLLIDGTAYGWCVYAAQAKKGIASAYLTYANEADESYYLCFNKNSVHLGAWNGSPDDAAIVAAHRLFTLP